MGQLPPSTLWIMDTAAIWLLKEKRGVELVDDDMTCLLDAMELREIQSPQGRSVIARKVGQFRWVSLLDNLFAKDRKPLSGQMCSQ